jgi:hypothetical protein
MTKTTNTKFLYAVALIAFAIMHSDALGGNHETSRAKRVDAEGVVRAAYDVGFKSSLQKPEDAALQYLSSSANELNTPGLSNSSTLQRVNRSSEG